MMAMFEVGDTMSKIKIKVTIKNKEVESSYETTGIIQDNELKYMEENNTKVTFNYTNNHLIRINEELRMDFIFDKNKTTQGTITIKELDKDLKVSIKTNKIEKENNNVLIEYSMEEDKFLYRIEEI